MKTQIYPRRGLHGEVVHRIGLMIMRGELRPGDPLPAESELSGDQPVSRTVLRESVKVLAAKGLVEARPKIGTRVRARSDWNLLDPDVLAWRLEASPDGVFLRNVVELRRIIEPEAARLAAERATDEEIAALLSRHFEFRLAGILKQFNLRFLPSAGREGFYRRLAAYGHVGRVDIDLPWEATDKVGLLRESTGAVLHNGVGKNK